MQELVYKQGQAGVQKATVTLVFNNGDSANSPLGYEQYDKLTITRQVVIGGRNKYLINGHVAQQNKVQSCINSHHPQSCVIGCRRAAAAHSRHHWHCPLCRSPSRRRCQRRPRDRSRAEPESEPER